MECTSLRDAVGREVSLTSIVGAISTSKDAWKAFQKFAEEVMTTKEEAERLREIGRAGLDLDVADSERMDDESDPGG